MPVATPEHLLADELIETESSSIDVCGSLGVAFRATVCESRSAGLALARADGLMLTLGEADVCVQLRRSRDGAEASLVKLYVGPEATQAIAAGVDIVVQTSAGRLVILFDCRVLSPDEELRPGTRLMEALAMKHAALPTQVVVDFLEGNDESEGNVDDRELFLKYFFPDLPSAGLYIDPRERFAQGLWGQQGTRAGQRCRVGVIYL